jgi:hypothetical protein
MVGLYSRLPVVGFAFPQLYGTSILGKVVKEMAGSLAEQCRPF